MYEYKATIIRVVDGDTIDVDIDLGFTIKSRQRLRLIGIDTPETYGVKKDSEEYKAGLKATEFVKEKCPEGSDVIIQTNKTGKYGRYLATIFIGDINLNELLLKEGLAEKY